MTQLYLKQATSDTWHEIEFEDTIALTCQMTDYSSPEAVKNAFSKTVSLNGTQKNVDFFKSIIDLSSVITIVDPCLKIDAMITVDGSLFDSGYITIDEITKKNGIFAFDITYYSNAGRFLYNLTTKDISSDSTADSSTSEYSLADLYWKLPNSDFTRVLTREEEKKSTTLFTLDSTFIYNNWGSMNTAGINWAQYVDKQEYKRGLSYLDEFNCNFAVVPMINGKYDTASPDRSLWYCPTEEQMNKFGVPFGYVSDSLGWIQAEMPRDMNEWEMNNLVALEQRIGVRLRKFLDVISYPENNGGFNVDFSGAESDEYVKSVMDYSFIVTPKIEANSDTSIFENDYIAINAGPLTPIYNTGDTEISYPSDIDNWKNLSLNLDLYFSLDTSAAKSGAAKVLMAARYKNSLSSAYSFDFNFFVVTVDYFHTVLGHTSKSYCVTSYNSDTNDLTVAVTKLRDYLNRKGVALTAAELEILRSMDNIIVMNAVQRPGVDQNVYKDGKYWTYWQNESPVSVAVDDLDKEYKQVKIRVSGYYTSWYNVDADPDPSTPPARIVACSVQYTDGSIGAGSFDYDSSSIRAVYDSANGYKSEYYNSTMSNVETTLIKKQTLFPEDTSPRDLFLQFIKTMNLRLYYDVNDDKIKVDTIKSFMSGGTDSLENKIDLSQEVKIKHNFYDFNILNYEFEQADTYPEYLYRMKTGRSGDTSYMYRTRLITGNTVNEDTSEYMDNNVIKSCADYNLSSNYFAPNNAAPMLKGASCKISYMTAAQSGDYSTQDAEKQWNLQNKYSDCVPKLCMMDKDESSIDGMIWCFHAGKVQLLNKLQVSNSLQVMNQISDGLCFCRFADHVAAEGPVVGYVRLNPVENGILGHNIGAMPLFSLYHYMKDGKMPVWKEVVSGNSRKMTVAENASLPKWSIAWATPKCTFSNMDVPKDNIYSRRFAAVNADIYRHESFTITASVKMTGNENIMELMRKFWWYDNCLFTLNKVSDFVVGQPGLYQWELLRVNDKGVYTGS